MFCKVISHVYLYSLLIIGRDVVQKYYERSTQSPFYVSITFKDMLPSFSVYILTISMYGQVREAIGVALSVLCSNIRLCESFDHDGSHESASKGLGNQFDGRSWVLFLKERASEVVINIQNTTQSDNLETPENNTPENGHLNGDSQADVKWMETVHIWNCFNSIFLII